MSVWRENEKLLDEPGKHGVAAERLRFTANDLGGTVEIDSQGRIVFRRNCGMRWAWRATLQLSSSREHIEVLTESEYNARKEGSVVTAREDY